MLDPMFGIGPINLPPSLNPLYERPPLRSANDLWLLEQEVYQSSAHLGDQMVALEIRKAHGDSTFVDYAVQKARDTSAYPLVNKGWRDTTILLQGGSRMVIKTPYLRQDHHGKPGAKRKKRGKNGAGIYPVLEALGIRDGISPATRSEIALHVVQAASYLEAADMLARRGLDCDASTLIRVANATAREDISLRDAALDAARKIPVPADGPLAGKRVRVSLDGGRVRVKVNRCGRRTRKGRHRYHTPWREPRIVVIEILDEEGSPDPLKLSLYDGLIGDADAAFCLLIGYLRLLGAAHAREVEFICDGADWIWERVERLITEADIPKENLVEVLDFYHASQYLCETLELCSHLSDKERLALYHKLLHDLRHHPEGISRLIQELGELAKAHPDNAMQKRINYFEKHAHRMQYANLDEMKLSVGSGCVESAVRRTINLRFKAPGSFWNEETVSGLIHLRAYFKAGRWNELISRILNKTFPVPSFERVPKNGARPHQTGTVMHSSYADDYQEEAAHI